VLVVRVDQCPVEVKQHRPTVGQCIVRGPRVFLWFQLSRVPMVGLPGPHSALRPRLSENTPDVSTRGFPRSGRAPA
jgi:hypothetical protein